MFVFRILRALPIAAEVIGMTSVLVGCVSPIALDQAVIEYDKTHSQIQTKLLLLNIARARNHNPIHFTAVPNVAATFDFRMNAGLTQGSLKNSNGLRLALGASVAENPTINIVPIQGEAFTKRLLTPMDESKFEFMAHQEVNIGLVLRLMVNAMIVEKKGIRETFHNNARQPEEFKKIRRVIFHLAALEYAGILDVGTINYNRQLSIMDKQSRSLEMYIKMANQGYRLTTENNNQVINKTVRGRMLISNYDPGKLSNTDRLQLDKKAGQYPHNFILVDIRHGYPGGEFPIHAWLKLRSFNAVIEFIASSMKSYPEFKVEKDFRSGFVSSNPIKTLEVKQSPEPPENANLYVEYQSSYYWLANENIRNNSNAQWNKEGLKLLYHLYQMTVMDVTHASTIPISIAK
jgi:hypothetical protein